MKPRLRRHFGYLWACVTIRLTGDPLAPVEFTCGCGYTPEAAIDEWRRIQLERA